MYNGMPMWTHPHPLCNHPYFSARHAIPPVNLPVPAGDVLDVEAILDHYLFKSHSEIGEFFNIMKSELFKIRVSAKSDIIVGGSGGQYLSLLVEFQKYFTLVVGPHTSWHSVIDRQMHVLRNWNGTDNDYDQAYHFDELLQLVRFVRNFEFHFDEICEWESRGIIDYRQRIANIIGGGKECFIPYILRVVPNLLPVLQVFEQCVSQPIPYPMFSPRHADIRNIIYELSDGVLRASRDHEKLLATFRHKWSAFTVGGIKSYKTIDFVKRSRVSPSERTIHLEVNENCASLDIRIPRNQGPDVSNATKFSWTDWKAAPLCIIVTDDYSRALDIFEATQLQHTVVLLGNFSGDKGPLRDECKRRRCYESSWNDLDAIIQGDLKIQRKILLYGSPQPLGWILDDDGRIFGDLGWKLLHDIIAGKQVELLHTNRRLESKPIQLTFGLPHNIGDQSLVLHGCPFTGKDTYLAQQLTVNNNLVVCLEADELQKPSFLKLVQDNELPMALAKYVTDNEFGHALVHNYLLAADKTAIIHINNFQKLLGKNYQQCLRWIQGLHTLPGTRIIVSTRNHCRVDLEGITGNSRELRFLARDAVTQFLADHCPTMQIPPWLNERDQFQNLNFTPLLCIIISQLLEEDSDNWHCADRRRLKICNALHNQIQDTCFKGIPDNYRNDLELKFLKVHTYFAFHCRFSNVNMPFLKYIYNSIKRTLTVSSLDYGILNFRDHELDLNEPMAQDIYFQDEAIVNFYVAYGVYVLSNQFVNEFPDFRPSWAEFLSEHIFNVDEDDNIQEIVRNVRAMEIASEPLNEEERCAFNQICNEFDIVVR